MNDEFEDYLHCKRWTDEENDPERIKHFDTSHPFQEYQKMWLESALWHIKNYEEKYPSWKKLGDEERERFWRK